jgi:Sister chromatid cohesion protein Dcc1
MSAAKKARHDDSILERCLPDQTGKHRISFSPEFRGRDFRLFELPEELVSQIESGEVVKIVGSTEPKSDAVICSKKKTYSLKKAETSNSVFVVPSSSSGEFTVTGTCQHYYELKPIAPRLEMVAEALRSAVYNGNDPEHEKRIDRSLLLSYEQLRATVQTSDTELENALFSLRVVELMGKMRMLSKKAVREVICDLIDTIIENSWPTDKVDEALCKQAMPDTDHVLLTFAFKSLGRMREERGLWELDHSAIARSTADNLFNSQVKAETVRIAYQAFPITMIPFYHHCILPFSPLPELLIIILVASYCTVCVSCAAVGLRRLPSDVGRQDARRRPRRVPAGGHSR